MVSRLRLEGGEGLRGGGGPPRLGERWVGLREPSILFVHVRRSARCRRMAPGGRGPSVTVPPVARVV